MASKYEVRFSDAKTFKDLTRMLDEWVFHNRSSLYGDLVVPFKFSARCESALTPGTLIQALTDKSVRRASSSSGRAATGVVILTVGENEVVWSPMTVLYMRLVGSSAAGLSELWLGNNGNVRFAQPTASGSLIQKVGVRLFYDASREKHLCFVMPSPDMGITIA